MTNEQAIENLKRLKDIMSNEPFRDTSEIIETCEKAIEALEKQVD